MSSVPLTGLGSYPGLAYNKNRMYRFSLSCEKDTEGIASTVSDEEDPRHVSSVPHSDILHHPRPIYNKNRMFKFSLSGEEDAEEHYVRSQHSE